MMRYKSAQAKQVELAKLLNLDLSEGLVELLQEMARNGTVTVSIDERGADDYGIYETPDGNCLRATHGPTDRRVHQLSLTFHWQEKDGSPYKSKPMDEVYAKEAR